MFSNSGTEFASIFRIILPPARHADLTWVAELRKQLMPEAGLSHRTTGPAADNPFEDRLALRTDTFV